MITMTIDTHENIKELQSAGFTVEQAEIQTKHLTKLVDTQLATKIDLLKLENKLTIRMGTMFTVNIVIIATMLKFFN